MPKSTAGTAVDRLTRLSALSARVSGTVTSTPATSSATATTPASHILRPLQPSTQRAVPKSKASLLLDSSAQNEIENLLKQHNAVQRNAKENTRPSDHNVTTTTTTNTATLKPVKTTKRRSTGPTAATTATTPALAATAAMSRVAQSLANDSDITDMLAQHNAQFKKQATYVPRTHSVEMIRRVSYNMI